MRSFGDVANAVAFGLGVGHCLQQERHVAAMIRMRRSPGGDGACQVAGLDGVKCGAANAHLAGLGEAARSHAALLAAHARGSDITWHHLVGAGKGELQAHLLRAGQHLLGGWVAGILRNLPFPRHPLSPSELL